MKTLWKLFRPSDVEIWRQLESEVGGRFVKGDSWHRDKVEVTHDAWTVTLDTTFSGATKTEYTRLRATTPSSSGFHFTIYSKGLFTDLAKMLGMQDVEVGYPEFDRDFVIKGNDEEQLRTLFHNDKIRALLTEQPAVHLKLDDRELCFDVPGVIRDIPRLKQLFALMTETLDQLARQAR